MSYVTDVLIVIPRGDDRAQDNEVIRRINAYLTEAYSGTEFFEAPPHRGSKSMSRRVLVGAVNYLNTPDLAEAIRAAFSASDADYRDDIEVAQLFTREEDYERFSEVPLREQTGQTVVRSPGD